MAGTFDAINFWAHMLDEAMADKAVLVEDRESKNMHKARKWIERNAADSIGGKTPQRTIEDIRNSLPNVRALDCKFLPGATRMWFEIQGSPTAQRDLAALNKALKIASQAHADKYDGDLNGMSFAEFRDKFAVAAAADLAQDRDAVGGMEFAGRSDYEIVAINGFADAKKYRRYTSWCVTRDELMYDTYTKNGLGKFYFCLKPGFGAVRKVRGEGCPMDEYGKSMIAVSVNDDGSLNSCTCRWNHDHGGNDEIMDTREISRLLGVNFYEVFLPRSPDELLAKYEEIRVGDDAVCKATGWMRCRQDDLSGEEQFYVRLSRNGIEKYPSPCENCFVRDGKFWRAESGRIVQGAPEKVDGDFIILPDWGISSLDGCPREVSGVFNCINVSAITSLVGGPQKAGEYHCFGTKITSLEGGPSEVADNYAVGGSDLSSLDGCPQVISGVFNCEFTKLTSLEGGPAEVGWIKFGHNPISSLKGAPAKCKQMIKCTGTRVPAAEMEAYEEFLKRPDPRHIDATGHYVP